MTLLGVSTHWYRGHEVEAPLAIDIPFILESSIAWKFSNHLSIAARSSLLQLSSNAWSLMFITKLNFINNDGISWDCWWITYRRKWNMRQRRCCWVLTLMLACIIWNFLLNRNATLDWLRHMVSIYGWPGQCGVQREIIWGLHQKDANDDEYSSAESSQSSVVVCSNTTATRVAVV